MSNNLTINHAVIMRYGKYYVQEKVWTPNIFEAVIFHKIKSASDIAAKVGGNPSLLSMQCSISPQPPKETKVFQEGRFAICKSKNTMVVYYRISENAWAVIDLFAIRKKTAVSSFDQTKVSSIDYSAIIQHAQRNIKKGVALR